MPYTGWTRRDCVGTGIERVEEVSGGARVRFRVSTEQTDRDSVDSAGCGHQNASGGAASATRTLLDTAVADVAGTQHQPGSPDWDMEDVAFMKHPGALQQVYATVLSPTPCSC